MPSLSRRVQILLDADRHRRLELRARATGASVGALVREAIDVAFPGVETDCERAGEALLSAAPMPVDDWERVKEDLLSLNERG